MVVPSLPQAGQTPAGVPQLVAPGLCPQCCGCAPALATAPEPGWPCVTAAVVPSTVGLGALTLEGKFGSIQESGAQTDFILLSYTLRSNDSYECSNPSPL